MQTIPRPAEPCRKGRRSENPGFVASTAIGLVATLLLTLILPSCAGVGSGESDSRQSVSQQRILEKLQRKTWSDPEALAEASKSRAAKAERQAKEAASTEDAPSRPVAPFDPFARPGSMPDVNEATEFDEDLGASVDTPETQPSFEESTPAREVVEPELADAAVPTETESVEDATVSTETVTVDGGLVDRASNEPVDETAPSTSQVSWPEATTTGATETAPVESDAIVRTIGEGTAPSGSPVIEKETDATIDPSDVSPATSLAEAHIPGVGEPSSEAAPEQAGSPTSLLEALSTGVREALATRAADREVTVDVGPALARETGDVEPMAVPAARFTDQETPAEDPATLTSTATEALSIELRDVPLKDLIRAIAQQNRMNVIVPETLTERVSISLDGVDPFEAVTSILKSNGYRLVSEGSLHRVEAIAEEEQRMESETFTLTSVPIASVQESLESILSESGKLIMNDDSPSFVMIDYPENLIAMADFLRLIDRREKQVLIEVHILEVILGENDAIGTSVEILDIGIDDTTLNYGHDLLPDSAFTTIGVVANQSPITATIQALSIRRKLNILSTPKIVTLNGREASIKVTSSIPYVDATATTSTTTEGGGATVVEQVEFTESGISLNVTPVIANDGYVKLKIMPEVKELVDFFNGIPVIDSRRIETNVLCQDGNTVILGGLLREEELQETQKTPILGDIPLVGAAFRRKEKRITKSELLVFITPYIIEGDAETRLNVEASDRLKQSRKAFTPRNFR